ncbi:MAG: hypothetical protein PHO37_16735 [Kiritimatiellae bacterium]|nr:hypothetical protein [Kiritimatiellia bacterium]
MNVIKTISWLLVVVGISLTISGPAWSKLQASHMHSLQKEMEQIAVNPDLISADSPVEKEFAKNMALQMSRMGDTIKYAMRLVYFGVLSSLIGFAGVNLSLSYEIKGRESQQSNAG